MASKDWVSAEKQDKNSDQIEKTQKVPILRFSEFIEEYEQKYLNELVERVKRKNTNLETILPLTISAQDGLINQEDFFNKKVASKNLRSYYLLFEGEFAYNKSYSNGNPWGVIKRLEKYSKGAVSTLYICFKPVTVESNFLKYYFESTKWFKEVSMIAIEGARNHGLLNIGITDFFQTKHYIPHSHREQEKIANFLSLVDKKIELMEKKYQFIKKYKMGLMQKIFSQEINFKGEDKELEVKKIGDYLIESKIVGEDKINKRLTVKLNLKGVYPRDTTTVEKIGATKQYIRKAGQFIYGKQNLFKGAFGIVPDYLDGYLSSSDIPSFDFKKNINPIWFYYYFSRESFYRKLEDLSTGTGSKRVSPNDFLKIKISIPSLKEQNEIADFLSKIDNKIDSVEQQLEKIKEFKKYLLQQMFV